MSQIYYVPLLASALMILNCTLTITNYRRYLQRGELETEIQLPLNVKLELYLALLIAIISCILMNTSSLKRTRLQNVLAESTPTYEKTSNVNRSHGLRNLQRSRGGAIFSAGISKIFPDAKQVMKDNKQLAQAIAQI